MPTTLVASTCSSTSGVTSGTGTIPPEIPALLTSTSSAPTVSTAAATLASSVTSSCDEARAQLLRGGAAARLVARADPHVVALGDQPPRRLVAEALVGSGDQGRGHASRVDAGRATTPEDSQCHPGCAIIEGWTRRPRRLPAHLARPARARPTSACAASSRRRAPGLRREEVAQLAGLSVDYLARLEQGRASAPSPSRARAARPRAAAERRRARPPLPRRRPGAARRGPDRPPHHAEHPARARPAAATCRSWSSTPPGSRSPRTPLATALLGDDDENVLRRHFAGETGARSCARPRRSRGWRSGAVADLHAAAGRYPDDEPLHELIADLRRDQPALRGALGAAAGRRATSPTARRSSTPRSGGSRSTATS